MAGDRAGSFSEWWVALGLVAVSSCSEPETSDAQPDDGTTHGCDGVEPCASTGSSDAAGPSTIGNADTTSAGSVADSDGSDGTTDCEDTQSDPQNCGGCGHDCLGGACVAGQCQAAAFFPLGSATTCALAVDPTHVFVLASFPPVELVAIDKRSGASTTLAAGGTSLAVAIDAEHVYYSGVPGLRVVPKIGGRSSWLADTQAKQIAVVDGFVAWADALNDGPFVIPIAGGRPAQLDVGVSGLAADATAVYWAGQGAPAGIFRAPIEGGTAVQLVEANATPLATDATFLFYAATQRVMRIPVRGGEPITLDEDFVVNAIALYADGEHVFVLGSTGAAQGIIARIPVQGGPATTLAIDFGTPSSFAVDAQSAFFCGTTPTPAIYRVAK